MKCAEAKTWLSFVTATRNTLRAAITPPPTALEQDHADRGAGEIGGGAGVPRIAFVAQRAIEGGDRRAPRGCAHAPGIDHLPRPLLHAARLRGPDLARHRGARPAREPAAVA